jgi:hypothetical protein
MTTFEELDAMSSQELHDRAMEHAEKQLDVRFFWDGKLLDALRPFYIDYLLKS